MNLTKTIETEYASITPERIAELKAHPFPKEFSNALTILLNEFYPKNDEFKDDIYSLEYEVSLGIVHMIQTNYTQEDISSFSLSLSSFEEHKYFSQTGNFLSALINLHQRRTKTGETYILFTEHLGKKINDLGINNEGSIIHIYGNCGDSCGRNMISGTILVEGSVEYSVGEKMRNGVIHIKGNTKPINQEIQICGGKIIIDGERPKIRISPQEYNLRRGNTGEIYHRDTKIYPYPKEKAEK